MYSMRLYTEVLFTPLLLAVLYLFVAAIEEPRAMRFAIAGAVMAFAILTRPSVALLPFYPDAAGAVDDPVSPPSCTRAADGAGILLYLAPWTLYTWRTHHRFMPLASSTAVLWQASPGVYHLVERGADSVSLFQNELNPAKNGGHDPFTLDGDRWFMLLGHRVHPIRTARLSEVQRQADRLRLDRQSVGRLDVPADVGLADAAAVVLADADGGHDVFAADADPCHCRGNPPARPPTGARRRIAAARLRLLYADPRADVGRDALHATASLLAIIIAYAWFELRRGRSHRAVRKSPSCSHRRTAGARPSNVVNSPRRSA